jgi:carboxyl-terminal processing protease
MKRSIKAIGLGLVLLMLPVIFSGFQDKDFELVKNLDIYHSVMRELNLYYVDETDPGKMVKTSIDDMLKTLDPYTVYVPESKMEDLELMTTGEYGGLGAMIGQVDGEVIITEPYEGFPAQKAGLRAGDIIKKVDGRSVEDESSQLISDQMKGQVGTKVKLTVKRPYTDEEITVELTREQIKLGNVPFYKLFDDGIAYIRLSGFTRDASKEVLDALNEMKKKGAKKLILDLRSNPGGLLIEAVDIMNIFVPQNQEIVSTRGKARQWDKTYYCRKEPVDTLMPVAVLVNSSSASASEIVAGAMQDLDRGVVIGERTFGKGLVQTTRDLSYNSKLKLTTAKYYIPSGRCIQALDYSNRRDDGSVGKIPDSLITEFKTQLGRTVYDGGGIVPDVKVENKYLSKVATAMVMQNKFFDFATRYRNTNPEPSSIQEFKISDQIYKEFSDYILNDNFTYQTGTERELNQLIEIAKREKYFNVAEEDLKSLQEKLAHDPRKDLELFRDELSGILSEEIISRYFYRKGGIELGIQDDSGIRKAREILGDEGAYKKLLSPEVVIKEEQEGQ